MVLFHAPSNVGVSLFPNGDSHYDPAVAGVIAAILVAAVVFIHQLQRASSLIML